MSSSSEEFSDISSYENHLQLPIKVNVSKKITEQSLGLQNLRKPRDILSNLIKDTTNTLGLKPQLNRTSKISHALEVLKKFDNKYKIKTSELPVPNVTKSIDSSNSSVQSKDIKTHKLGAPSHQPTPRSRPTQALEVKKLDPSYDSKHSNDTIPKDKISKGIREPYILPEVATVDEIEDYESDFESSDDESLSAKSDDAEDDDSSGKSQSSLRPRSALTKPNSDSSETESSIHTIADEGSNSVENVGLFGNIRLFTFSDLGPNGGQKIDELSVPVHLKDSSTRHTSGARPIEKGRPIDESKIKSQSTLEIPIPSNVITAEKATKSLDKSSDFESISECLSNSSESDESSVPFRRNIFTMDDLNGADSGDHRKALSIVQGKDNTKPYEAKAHGNHDIPSVTEKLSTLMDDIEEIDEDESAKQTEERVVTCGNSTIDNSYGSDSFSDESEDKLEKESGEESSRLSGENRSVSVVSDVHSGRSLKKQTHDQKIKSRPTTSVDERNQSLSTVRRQTSSAKGGRTGIEGEPTKIMPTMRDASVQTDANGFAGKVREGTERRKARPPRPVIEALNLSWDFDNEANDKKPVYNLQRQTLTPEVIEALANQNPAEDALDQVLKHQIALTKNFMASQYKMYQTYCRSVKHITDQYTPVTLEETKEYIRRHQKMRTNANQQQVFN